MNSHVIITNTTQRPIFIEGKILGVGMSMETHESNIPEQLVDTPAIQRLATETVAPETTQPPSSPKTDEDALVEAVGKARK